jgi:hypothetical protein
MIKKTRNGQSGEIYSEIMTVTPKIANEWLVQNTCNRRVRPNKVSRFSRLIENGLWHTTHQGVAFYEDMTLCDGQHRLLAIVKSGVAVKIMVTYGLPKDVNPGIDNQVTARTMADAMSFMGHTIDRNTSAILRVLNNEMIRQHNGANHWETEAKPEPEEFEKLWLTFQDSIAFATAVKMSRNKDHSCFRAAIAAASFTKDKKRLLEMLEIVNSGTCEKATDNAAIKIRDHLMIGSFSTSYAARTELYQKCCAAIDAFLRHKPLAKLFARNFDELTFTIPQTNGV